MDDKLDTFAAAIRAHFPELTLTHIQLAEQGGQYNDLVFVNNDLVFRFPKFANGIETMRREVHILSRIQGQTTLPIPDPIYLALGGNTPGAVFMGYPRLPGQPFWREIVPTMTQAACANMGRQFGQFLHELHHIPVALLGPGLPVQDSVSDWVALFATIQKHLFPRMRPDARAGVTAHFQTFFAAEADHAYTPALRHGDFGSSNILIDAKHDHISAIIDFGFAGIGDPALDIAAIATMGADLFTHVAAAYPDIEPLLARAQFYRGTYALDEALYGLKHHDPDAFARGMAAYV